MYVKPPSEFFPRWLDYSIPIRAPRLASQMPVLWASLEKLNVICMVQLFPPWSKLRAGVFIHSFCAEQGRKYLQCLLDQATISFFPQVTTLWWIHQSFNDGKTILDSSGKFSMLDEWINSVLPGVSCELEFLICLLFIEQGKDLWCLSAQASISTFPRYLDYAGLIKVPRLVRQKPILREGPSEKLRVLDKFINLFHTMSEEGSQEVSF